MKYYDAMPGALRLLIDLAPIPQDTKEVWAVYQRDGLEKTLESVAVAFEAFAPGWKLVDAIAMWKPHRRARR